MKKYISHISKFISLTLILLIMSFGMIMYAYYNYSKPVPVSEEPHAFCGVIDVQNNPTAYTPEQVKGEAIFRNSCSSCHAATDEVIVGPGLKGISKRRSIAWTVRFVNNPQAVIASGDRYANRLYQKYNKAQMTAYPRIKEKDIKALIAYLDNK